VSKEKEKLLIKSIIKYPNSPIMLSKLDLRKSIRLTPEELRWVSWSQNKSLKSRRNMKLIRAMNEYNDSPDAILNKTEEEKRTGTKGSSGSNDQNLFLNLNKKSQSNSRSNSNNLSDNKDEKLSSYSDLRHNSNNSQRPEPRTKTEKSLSIKTGNEKVDKYSPLKIQLKTVGYNHNDPDDTLKTPDVNDTHKFNGIEMDGKLLHRSKSFSKP
jgi:hypothetical protein